MRVRALFATAAAGLALLVVPAGVAAAAGPVTSIGQPTILLGCDASPSVTAPAAHSRIAIRMDQLAGGIGVDVTVHFRSGNVTHRVKSTAAGRAASAFDIGSAPRGVRVPVTVSATRGSLGWVCRTSFVVR